jgi:hypothetical protein
MTQIHRLTDQVIGIYTDPAEVAQALRAAGYEIEVMTGEQGHDRLDPTGKGHGLAARLLRLAAAFDDERRILEAFDQAVQRGEAVVAADTDAQDPTRAVEIMKEHGGRYVWRFEAGTHYLVAD